MSGADEFPGGGMTCEEFEMAGLDLDYGAPLDSVQQGAWEHLRHCSKCAALQENWQMLRAELRVLGRETSLTEMPARAEMRLRQSFQAKRKTQGSRHAAFIAALSLAAAAALLAAVSWIAWRQERGASIAQRVSPSAQSPMTISASGIDAGEVLVASNESGDFTLLPASVPSSLEDATVVRVEMERAALGALGLTVNEEKAGDWIQVDLLVGNDGLPEAVRLPESPE